MMWQNASILMTATLSATRPAAKVSVGWRWSSYRHSECDGSDVIRDAGGRVPTPEKGGRGITMKRTVTFVAATMVVVMIMAPITARAAVKLAAVKGAKAPLSCETREFRSS